MNPAKSLLSRSFMYKNPTQNVTYDKPNFKDRKIFLKDNESEIK